MEQRKESFIGKSKQSYIVAILLSTLSGPFGILYTNVMASIIMMFYFYTKFTYALELHSYGMGSGDAPFVKICGQLGIIWLFSIIINIIGVLTQNRKVKNTVEHFCD